MGQKTEGCGVNCRVVDHNLPPENWWIISLVHLKAIYLFLFFNICIYIFLIIIIIIIIIIIMLTNPIMMYCIYMYLSFNCTRCLVKWRWTLHPGWMLELLQVFHAPWRFWCYWICPTVGTVLVMAGEIWWNYYFIEIIYNQLCEIWAARWLLVETCSGFQSSAPSKLPTHLVCFGWMPCSRHRIVEVLVDMISSPVHLQEARMIWTHFCARNGHIISLNWFLLAFSNIYTTLYFPYAKKLGWFNRQHKFFFKIATCTLHQECDLLAINLITKSSVFQPKNGRKQLTFFRS